AHGQLDDARDAKAVMRQVWPVASEVIVQVLSYVQNALARLQSVARGHLVTMREAVVQLEEQRFVLCRGTGAPEVDGSGGTFGVRIVGFGGSGARAAHRPAD